MKFWIRKVGDGRWAVALWAQGVCKGVPVFRTWREAMDFTAKAVPTVRAAIKQSFGAARPRHIEGITPPGF
jgi:hypothetical protein